MDAQDFFVLRPLYFSVYISPEVCRGRVYRPFSILDGGASGLHTSGTGGRAREDVFLCFGLCIFYLHFYRSLWGAGGASASLLSAAALVVCIQAVREGGRAGFFCILPPLYFFIRISSGVCGGQGGQAPLYSRWRRLWYAYQWNGRAGARGLLFRLLPPFCPYTFLPECVGGRGCKRYKRYGRAGARGGVVFFLPCIFLFAFLPECMGGMGCKRISTLGGSACGMHTSGTGGQAREDVFLCFGPCTFPFTLLPEFVGGRGCKRLSTLGDGACGMHTSGTGGRARVFFLYPSSLVILHLHFFRSLWGAGGARASLLSVALAVCILVGRKGRRTRVFVSYASALLSIHISPGLCGGQGMRAPLNSRRRRLRYAYKRDGRAGARGLFFMFPSF